MTQYWDGEGITGTYFAETDLGGLGYSGFVYDVYYVFGPDATWADEPGRSQARAGPSSRRATSSSLAALITRSAVGVLLSPDAEDGVGAAAEHEEERERVGPARAEADERADVDDGEHDRRVEDVPAPVLPRLDVAALLAPEQEEEERDREEERDPAAGRRRSRAPTGARARRRRPRSAR